MRETLAKLLSSDDTQASMLHLVLVIEVGASVLPMFVMCYLALRSGEPFSATVAGMASFIRVFGVGVAALFGGAGSMWWLKRNGQSQ